MGQVFLAEDTRLERKVALKFLPHHAAQEDAEKARFIQEAKAAARLTHNNIAQVYEIGEEEGRLFIVMEYMGGGSLRDQLEQAKSKSLPLEKVLTWVQEAAQGLAEAHKQGIIHRDIKPDNLMLTESGQIKITDFGLARLETATRLTISGAALGTVNYMSPEQVTGRDVDHRADLFSLGATFYELLTGHRAFEGADANATYFAILNQEVEPVSRFRRNLPDTVDITIQKLIAKEPKFRFQSAADLVADISRMSGTVIEVSKKGKLSQLFISKLRTVNVEIWISVVLILASIGLLLSPNVSLYRNMIEGGLWYGYGEYDFLSGPLANAGRHRHYDNTEILQDLERLKATRDIDAYIASSFISDNPDQDIVGAISLKPSDSTLHALRALMRMGGLSIYAPIDSIVINSIYRAFELDNENGSYAYFIFAIEQAQGNEQRAELYLRRATTCPRFSFGWSEYYSALYRSYRNLNKLQPFWGAELPYPRMNFMREATESFLSVIDAQDKNSTVIEDEVLCDRGALIEAVGSLITADDTAPLIQLFHGRTITELGIDAQLRTLDSDLPQAISLENRKVSLEKLHTRYSEAFFDRNDLMDNIILFTTITYSIGLLALILFFVTVLVGMINSVFYTTFQFKYNKAMIKYVQSIMITTFVVGILLAIGLFVSEYIIAISIIIGITAIITELLTAYKLVSSIFKVFIYIVAVLICLLLVGSYFPPIIVLVLATILPTLLLFTTSKPEEELHAQLNKMCLRTMPVWAIIVFIVVLSFVFQSISIAPELIRLMSTPNPII